MGKVQKRNDRSLVCCLLFVVSIFVFISATRCHAESNSIRISEIMWRGSSVSNSDEWIELYNPSPEIIDLSGYQLLDVVTDKTMVKIDSGEIAPRGHFLISNNVETYMFSGGESILDIAPDIVDSDISLNNDHFSIQLIDSKGVTADSAGNGKKPFFGEYNGAISSMQRFDFEMDGSQEAAWEVTKTQLNLDKGVMDYATPENSGRPLIENFVFKNSIYELNSSYVAKTEFEIKNPLNNLDKIKIKISNAPKELVYYFAPDEREYALGQFDYCPIIEFIFINDTGLSTRISKNSTCLDPDIKAEFSEVLFRPKDFDGNGDGKIDRNDEFFELKNPTTKSINLDGFVVEDLSGKQYKLKQTVEAGGYVSIFRSASGLILNDDGETLILKNPLGEIVDQIRIPASNLYDVSYAKFENEWKLTKKVTPNKANIFISTKEDGSATTAKSEAVAPGFVATQIVEAALVESPDEETQKSVTTYYTTIYTSPLASIDGTALDQVSVPRVLGRNTNRNANASNTTSVLLYSFSGLCIIFLVRLYGIYRLE